MRPILRSAALLVLLSAMSCVDASAILGSATPPGVVPVDRIKVSPQSMVLTTLGETRAATATVGPANATDRLVIWESSDPAIVSVDSTGVVTAKAPGAGVFVTAFSHDRLRQASVNVSVVP